MKIEANAIIDAYKNGQSMNSIAKAFGTYPTTVRRILLNNNIELRHDAKRSGSLYVQDGEKLIKWAKEQGRLVTKAELAQVINRKRLSPSYFLKYPELGQYIQPDAQNELQDYYEKLYKWLQDNKIPYKPNDRTKLKIAVDALLLDEYSNIAICISEKPSCVSTKKYEKNMKLKKSRAEAAGINIIFLYEKDFENLDKIKDIINSFKK